MKPFTNKHSIAAGSPLHVGDKKKSVQPNRGVVDKNPTSRLVYDGSIVRERATNEIVLGGGRDASENFTEQRLKKKRIKDSEKNNSMAIRWRYQRDW